MSILQGGIILWIIVAISVVAVAVVFERVYKLINFENIKDAKKLRHLLREGNIVEAAAQSEKSRSYLSKGLSIVLKNSDMPLSVLKERINRLLLSVSEELEGNLWVVRYAMYIAPILGLLGTVTGMIRVFGQLSSNVIDPTQFAGGIAEALITTAAGLTALLPLALLYGFVERRIDKVLIELEGAALEALSIVKGESV